MAQLKSYPKYKDSGVEWLGKVPEHWSLSKINFQFNLGRGRVISQQELQDNGLYPVFSSQTKNNGCLGFLNTYNFDCKQITWTTDGANAGTVFLRQGKHNCTNVCGTLQPKINLNLNFYSYYLMITTPHYKRPDTNGAKIMNNEMANILSISLPLSEQAQIANYLDQEAAKIDTLIAKQEKLIDLLEEQRKSIISHAVTKGLDPNAPMKDSGVEWLGKVPEHWEIKPIKSLYNRVKKTGFEQEILLSVYREYGVIIKSSRDDNHNRASDDLSPYQLVNISDLVINKMKAWQGSLAISEYKGIVSPAYYIYTPIKTNSLNNKFIHNQIRSKYFIQSYKNFSKGIRVGQWDLENDLFVRINLYIPPLTEQTQIADYLDQQTNKIDTLKAKQKKLIEKLKEYKASIISHAVTGKIDVRELAA